VNSRLCILIVALFASPTRAQEVKIDRSLPRYRPIAAGVAGVIRGHSSAGMNKLMTIWGRGFRSIYPKARVVLDDKGWVDVRGGAATFGPWLRHIGERETKRLEKHFGYVPMRIDVCFYVLAAYVHKDNPYRGGLSMDGIESIFSARFKDATWGDLGLGGEWSERPIMLYARDSHRFFLRYRCSLDFSFKNSVRWRADDAAVASSLAQDVRGLGLAVIGCQAESVRTLPIAGKGSSEFIAPTADNARKGAYPLSAPFYLLLNHDPHSPDLELDPLRREFLRYCLSREGQQAVIKAGYVPLSAALAKTALEKAGLSPSGQGSWDAALTRLRARRVPRKQMSAIASRARKIGDRPTGKELAGFSTLLARTGLTSSVKFETEKKGAKIRIRLMGFPEATVEPNEPVTLSIGLYHVWTERDGKATSPKGAWFQVVREHERIRIYETE
jgi:phosphate transport system substrate-binding protein